MNVRMLKEAPRHEVKCERGCTAVHSLYFGTRWRCVSFSLLGHFARRGNPSLPCAVVAGLLARSQNPEGPATGHLGTGFSGFPCV
jgi:hypothetical protein